MNKTKRQGFTLIELLVVIAIIAILAAILFPVFARARENARRTTCVSNLKQISLGIFQYTQDYDERLPPLYVNGPFQMPNGQSTNLALWMHIIYPYVKSVQIFNCPSESGGTYKGGYYWEDSSGAGATQGSGAGTASYGVSSLLMTGHTGLSLARLSDTATTPLIVENTSYSTYPAMDFTSEPHHPVARHLETCVMGFADGHAKSVKLSDWTIPTWSGDRCNYESYKKWDPDCP